MVKPFVVEGQVTSEYLNQSLPGLIYRLATHSPSLLTYVNEAPVPARFDNLLALSLPQARWLVRGCFVLFAALVMWCCRTPAEQRQGWRMASEVGMVLLGMLLLGERTWKHHCVTFMVPFAVLWYHLVVVRPAPRIRSGLLAVLVAALLLTTMTGLGTVQGRQAVAVAPGFAKTALIYGAYTVTCLLLLGALAVVLRVGQERNEKKLAFRDFFPAKARNASLSARQPVTAWRSPVTERRSASSRSQSDALLPPPAR